MFAIHKPNCKTYRQAAAKGARMCARPDRDLGCAVRCVRTASLPVSLCDGIWTVCLSLFLPWTEKSDWVILTLIAETNTKKMSANYVINLISEFSWTSASRFKSNYWFSALNKFMKARVQHDGNKNITFLFLKSAHNVVFQSSVFLELRTLNPTCVWMGDLARGVYISGPWQWKKV